MKKDRAKATAEYEARQDRTIIEAGPFCTCAQYRLPHKPHGLEPDQKVAAIYKRLAEEPAQEVQK